MRHLSDYFNKKDFSDIRFIWFEMLNEELKRWNDKGHIYKII